MRVFFLVEGCLWVVEVGVVVDEGSMTTRVVAITTTIARAIFFLVWMIMMMMIILMMKSIWIYIIFLGVIYC